MLSSTIVAIISLLIVIFPSPVFGEDSISPLFSEREISSAALFDSPNIPVAQTKDLETKIIHAFNSEGCERTLSLVAPSRYDTLSPTPLAVIAYCIPSFSSSEIIFAHAGRLEPSNETVALLHAHRVWKTNPTAAMPLWRQALLLSRTTASRQKALNFLEGRGSKDEKFKVETDWSYYVSLLAGAIYETNPLLAPSSAASPGSSFGTQALVSAGVQRSLSIGTLSSNYLLNYGYYFEDNTATVLKQSLEVPLALRAGTNEDLKIRPFGSFIMLGTSPYEIQGGLGVVGVAYRGKHRQTLEGSVFVGRFYNANLRNQEGTHFRFDYTWELYPADWLFRVDVSIEHVQAGRTRDALQGINIPFSHNDLGLQALIEYNFRWVIAGIDTAFLIREDDNSSTYLSNAAATSKQRQDIELILTPSLTIPLQRNLQLFTFFHWSQRFSNIGPRDYLDQNFGDLGTGMALRWLIGN